MRGADETTEEQYDISEDERFDSRMCSETDFNFDCNRFVSHNDFNFVVANARSLRPKLYSLIDTLEENDGHMAVIT